MSAVVRAVGSGWRFWLALLAVSSSPFQGSVVTDSARVPGALPQATLGRPVGTAIFTAD